MSAKKRPYIGLLITISCFIPLLGLSANEPQASISPDTVAKELGWVDDDNLICGGYYLEQPFTFSEDIVGNDNVEITSKQGFLAQRATSVLDKEVTITRQGQQITANRVYLYRDPLTWKLSATEMIGNVHLREPNTLVIGKRGRYNFQTKTKSLIDILYRTTMSYAGVRTPKITPQDKLKTRKITSLTAWGQACEFSQTEPKVYEFTGSSFSTCPPTNPSWTVKASHIVLNKNTGRGYATNARIYLKSIPILYMPYINFSIDKQRKSGLLWPTVGNSDSFGPYIIEPVYWNIAPNYDMTIAPGYLNKRGLQLSDEFRYLTRINHGDININVVPNDREFAEFQKKVETNPAAYNTANKPPSTVDAEVNRLENSNTTRLGLSIRDDSVYNAHWASHVDFNYASDDYYLKDFGSNLNETTANQLLQEVDLYYKGLNWNFTGRLQAYQTLHPISDAVFENQYRRFPQLVFMGDYPDQKFGLEYFIETELTHFDIRNTPGTENNLPIGNRYNLQPGISLPYSLPYFYINPRFQLALTEYELYQTSFTNTPNSIKRAVPIFDMAVGTTFSRSTALFGRAFEQTLEPLIYYTYIPYRDQSDIPIFDTSTTTLTYDQIFTYNRFSGIDRIGDANQIAVGVTTRLIDQMTGIEKVRLGLGEIVYFANRLVTFCNNDSCADNPSNRNNYYRVSPLTATLDYHVSPVWNFTVNSIWNTTRKELSNATLNFHYQPDADRIINLGYTFARNGDYFSGINEIGSENNLKLTEISFAWPVLRNVSAVGRWTEDWNTYHFQNILYGLQYDTCCWSVRFLGGRTFTGLNNTGSPEYNNAFYLQFDLKGLGDIGSGSGNPSTLLNTINGYKNKFGR